MVLWVTDAAMGTVRTIMILRDLHKWAMLSAFVGVTIWVVAISQVLIIPLSHRVGVSIRIGQRQPSERWNAR